MRHLLDSQIRNKKQPPRISLIKVILLSRVEKQVQKWSLISQKMCLTNNEGSHYYSENFTLFHGKESNKLNLRGMKLLSDFKTWISNFLKREDFSGKNDFYLFQFFWGWCSCKWKRLYTRYHETPQKACERGYCHVMAFSQFFEMPQNRTISISVHFKNRSPAYFLKCPIFPIVRIR